jgi:hypothetical protein
MCNASSFAQFNTELNSIDIYLLADQQSTSSTL